SSAPFHDFLILLPPLGEAPSPAPVGLVWFSMNTLVWFSVSVRKKEPHENGGTSRRVQQDDTCNEHQHHAKNVHDYHECRSGKSVNHYTLEGQ
nr:hypothetical protein [Thermaerobacter sp.]